jgi:hypothetical protein
MGDLFGKDNSPPPAPDYAAAARAQGAGNLQTAIAQSLLNRPNEVTPYGSRSWNQIGTQNIPGAEGNPAVDIPMFQSSVNLTPLGQRTFDTQQRISDQLGSTAEQGLGRVQNTFSTPFGVGNVNELQNKAEGLIMSRLEPKLERNRELMTNALKIKGHNPQGEAYGADMKILGEQENDARNQAMLTAFQMRPQALQEEMAIRNVPLNEVNALRTGAQVNMPQFNQAPAGQIAQTPIFQAAQAQGNAALQGYNTQQMADAQMMSGLFGLGGAIAGLPTGGGSSVGGSILKNWGIV